MEVCEGNESGEAKIPKVKPHKSKCPHTREWQPC